MKNKSLKTYQQHEIESSFVLYLHHKLKRIAGTIRGFRTLNLAQKDGLLAAFFGLFLCLKMTFWQQTLFRLLLFFADFCGFFDSKMPFYSFKNASNDFFDNMGQCFSLSWWLFELIGTGFWTRRDELKVWSGRVGGIF